MSKQILMLVGDYAEDYETMVPFQFLTGLGYTVHAVCRHHRASSVGDDDKLRVARQLMQVPGKPVYVGIVECRLNLIKQAKWRRF